MNYQPFLNRDCKSLQTPKKPRLRRHHLHLLAVASGVAGLVALFNPSHDAEANRNPAPEVLAVPPAPVESVELATPRPDAGGDEATTAAKQPQLSATAPAIEWRAVEVRSGDTLSGIFQSFGLGPTDVYRVTHAEGPIDELERLQPGRSLRFHIEEGELQALQYALDPTRTLTVETGSDGFTARLDERAVEVRTDYASAEIHDSLFMAARRAGLPDNLTMELAGIFGWDIDFALDIRKGDSFSVLYEEEYLDGEKLRNGNILAAEFVNKGKRFQAVRFTDPTGNSGYFTPEGLSMRKAFLRSPVDFRRISSRFQPERYHPVLGKKRPHRGVDYAAATGTPIKASGDGKVVYRGRKGGYGRTVIIQHGTKYSTLYAHMSNYRRGVNSGTRVKQGQIIGYVGQSGLATGPHLHYEFRVNGVHRNPLTVELPTAEPISAEYRDEFEQQTAALVAQLERLGTDTRLAFNTNE